MARNNEWSIAEPRTLSFAEDPVQVLEVRVMGGTVNVVGTDEPAARLEISAVNGPPLLVSLSGERLVVGYRDLPWQGFLPWLSRRRASREAVISLSVPRGCRVTLAAVGAEMMINGVSGPCDVNTLTGDVTLVGLGGRVSVESVSGAVAAQSVTGPLRFHSVSGDLTALESGGPSLTADSVSGSLVIDIADAAPPPDVRLGTISGELALRVPEQTNATISGHTITGAISCAIPGMRVGGWRARQLSASLGSGAGSISCSSVSGPIVLLPGPAAEASPSAEESAADEPRVDRPTTARKDV
ncbi:hypothetical protein [Streptomyces sp. NBRC 109706]|uniref:DUF4097 family beta strand repeat-containing protein n=1 Tax=Streptomyces sp. NBRC 109706 TaxID=1550035 RepID=UPI000782F76F|nr:hypothetical protein [Streptomyces sp. NBRC 109706]